MDWSSQHKESIRRSLMESHGEEESASSDSDEDVVMMIVINDYDKVDSDDVDDDDGSDDEKLFARFHRNSLRNLHCNVLKKLHSFTPLFRCVLASL